MKRRGNNDIWQGMYDFPLIETGEQVTLSLEEIAERVESLFGKSLPSYNPDLLSIHSEDQILSHQKIHCRFYPIFVEEISPEGLNLDGGVIVDHGQESIYAVPKVIDCYFRVKSIFL
jgi:A/G-specific adenine glycosylase